jgi:hypothetical protein
MTSRSRRIVVVTGLVVVLAAGFAVAALRRPGQASVRLAGAPVSVLKTVSSRDPLFGDTVTAAVDVFVDTRRVDAGSVRIRGGFAPFRVASRTGPAVRRTGDVSVVHVEYRLTCLDGACVPEGEHRTLRLPALRVGYRDGARAVSLSSAWPALRVHTRVTAGDLQRPFLRVGPPRPSPTRYRLPPEATGYTLLALAALLALGGAALALRTGLGAGWLPRRRSATPLEQILRELAAASSNGDSGRRRRALEHLARELEPVSEPLSVESRVLAWAPQEPGPEAIADLTSRVEAEVRR